MGLIIEFVRVRPDAVPPTRANPSDAGLDLFFNPADDQEVKVDPGYSGEVVIIMHNVGRNPQMIKPGEKIAQAVLYPVVHVRPIQVDENELYSDNIAMSDRDEKDFGSTDNK